MKLTTIGLILSVALPVALLGPGCGKDKKDEAKSGATKPGAAPGSTKAKTPAGATKAEANKKPEAPKGPPPLIAHLESKSGSTTTGTAWFTQKKNVVTIKIKLEGAPPGLHGFHIHEVGDCSSDDAKSAGGHFNPGATEHGKPDGMKHHGGDFGNLSVMAGGKGEKMLGSESITIGPGANSILGKAVVIHADRDDLKSQPSGNAGARIACGVIEVDKTAK